MEDSKSNDAAAKANNDHDPFDKQGNDNDVPTELSIYTTIAASNASIQGERSHLTGSNRLFSAQVAANRHTSDSEGRKHNRKRKHSRKKEASTDDGNSPPKRNSRKGKKRAKEKALAKRGKRSLRNIRDNGSDDVAIDHERKPKWAKQIGNSIGQMDSTNGPNDQLQPTRRVQEAKRGSATMATTPRDDVPSERHVLARRCAKGDAREAPSHVDYDASSEYSIDSTESQTSELEALKYTVDVASNLLHDLQRCNRQSASQPPRTLFAEGGVELEDLSSA